MPSLNLQAVPRRKHFSEPMGGDEGGGGSLLQRTASISITRSKPLSIHKNKQKSKFDVDFHLKPTSFASSEHSLVAQTNADCLVDDEANFEME